MARRDGKLQMTSKLRTSPIKTDSSAHFFISGTHSSVIWVLEEGFSVPCITSAKDLAPLLAGLKILSGGFTGRCPVFFAVARGCFAQLAINFFPRTSISFSPSRIASIFCCSSTFENLAKAKKDPVISFLPATYTSTKLPSLAHGVQSSLLVVPLERCDTVFSGVREVPLSSALAPDSIPALLHLQLEIEYIIADKDTIIQVMKTIMRTHHVRTRTKGALMTYMTRRMSRRNHKHKHIRESSTLLVIVRQYQKGDFSLASLSHQISHATDSMDRYTDHFLAHLYKLDE
ncbi:hypothetical protein LXL04_017508 [Taraxacum kok-saghyz]